MSLPSKACRLLWIHPFYVFQFGDYVLCRVVNHDTDLVCYVPGRISMAPAKEESAVKFYMVTLFTGHRVCKNRVKKGNRMLQLKNYR